MKIWYNSQIGMTLKEVHAIASTKHEGREGLYCHVNNGSDLFFPMNENKARTLVKDMFYNDKIAILDVTACQVK